MARKDSGWWDEFFPAFRPVFDTIPNRVSNAQVRYLIRKLGLKRGSSFLDCPCGIGRTALPLAKAGVRVTGVDITGSYLEECEKKARRRGLSVKLVKTDMRRINFNREFDAAGNIFTSFGYFKKESDNLLVLKRAFAALKSDGKFILHLINRDWIVHNFTPSDWSEMNGLKVLNKRKFNYASSSMDDTWLFMKDGEEQSIKTYLRMYSLHELITMFKKVGFCDVEGFSSVQDDPVTRDSRYMFIFGTRPKRRQDV